MNKHQLCDHSFEIDLFTQMNDNSYTLNTRQYLSNTKTSKNKKFIHPIHIYISDFLQNFILNIEQQSAFTEIVTLINSSFYWQFCPESSCTLARNKSHIANQYYVFVLTKREYPCTQIKFEYDKSLWSTYRNTTYLMRTEYP